MKLTKQQESEILDVYEAYWGSLLNVDLEIYIAVLDENFKLIGSTETEFFNNRKEAVEFLKETVDQVAGVIERRNPRFEIEAFDGFVLITEQFDTYVLIEDDWSFYAKTRVSTWLQQKNEGWTLIQQHISFPDTKADEGQTIGLEKISKENLELKEAIKRRTAELENKNRELEIESALERIRARTMAMHQSSELSEVLTVLFDQFDILGINPVFAHLSLIDLENNTFTYRMTGRGGQRVLTTQVVDLDARDEWKDSVKAFKKGKPNTVSCLHFPKEALPQIWELFSETLGALPKGAKIYQKDFPNGLFNTQGFCKFGYIGFNHNRPATGEEKDIVVRFATEFGRIYQRYLDIEKAEAQTRESQIQLSLERVRARSMAMQSSDELHEVLSVLFQQFDRLGIEPINVFLSLFNKEERTLTYRATGKSGKRMPSKQVVEVDSMEALKALFEKWLTDNSDTVEVIYYPKEVLPQLFGIFDETFAAMPEEDRMGPEDFPDGGYSMAGYTPFGYLGYDHQRQATAEEKDILSRFCIEFSRVYQRFLDIQKAEAQAREAQIEASLERIRTRSMAMHSSDELNDVLSVLFQQIEVLGIDAKSAHLTLMDVENNKFSFRITGKNGATNIGEQIIDLDAMPIWKDTVTNWKKAKLHSHQCLVYPPEMLPELWKLIDESLKTLPAKERIKIKDFPNGVFDCEGHTKFGYIGFNNSRPPTEEEISIIIRFAREFERVYQRFIDIEKAEAQAREAQIEAALERVRAASMAMHQSTELHEVVLKVSEEISNLGLNIHATHLYRWDEKDLKGLNVWFASVDGVSPNEVYWPYFRHSIFDGIENARKKGKILFTALLNKSEKNRMYRHLINKTSIEVPQERQDFALKAEGLAFSVAVGKNAGIAILRFTKEAFNSAENEILIRFTNVFEQAFTRFLDLQKAEAQAREALIQLALERVRARSMAMHSSEELNEVLSILFQQFDVLGIKPINVWLSLLDEEKGTFTYRATGISGSRTHTQQVIAFNAMDIWQEVLEQWKSGNVDPVLITHYPAERLPEMFEIFKETFMAMPEKERINITAFPNGFYNIQGYCKFGYIGYNHINPPTEEEKDIVTKFAREFERVYQRFLDIEKAEAQTKEAQIEAALERLRAASMAMHQTEDIGNVVQVYFEQLKYLEIPFEQAWITILKLEEGYFDTWFSPIDGIYDKPTHFKMPSAPFEDTAIKNWKAGVPLSYMSLKTRSEVDQFLSACDEMTNSKYFTYSQKKRNNNKLEFLEARHKFGFISKTTKEAPTKEDEEILMRFASVFEQTYTRFLDIQKAELQAREAQIEASLEKVRSRSLAMQSAEELQEVVTIVGEKLQELGVILDSGGVVICTYFPDSKDVLHWTATFDSSHLSVPYYLPYFDTPIWKETWHSKFETDDDFFEKVYSFEDKNHFFHYAFEHSDYKNLPDEYKKALLESETHALSFAWQTNSALMVASHTGMLLPAEHKNILKRFAKVFEQAYIRFMDLEKAEKQAREAQIELSLERVRAKAMAMRESEELTEVLPVIFEQLDGLGVKTVWTHLTLMDMEKNTFTYRMTGREGKRVFAEQVVDMDASEIWQNAVEAFKAEEPDSIVRFYFPPDALPGIWEIFDGIFSTLSEGYKIYPEDFPVGIYTTQANCEFGYIGINNTEKATVEEENILLRFAKEFGRLYRRFLDLQNAEAQAREAQIEVAMERVRARAMAMHQTDELTDVLCVLFDQFDFLGINPVLTHLTLMDEANETFTLRITSSAEKRIVADQVIDINAVESWKTSFANWKKSELHAIDCIDYSPDALPFIWELMDEVMSALPEGHKIYPEDFPDGLYTTQGHCKFGYIGFNHKRRATEEEKQIVVRIAKEFGRLYQRFLDIQKAEAQAREAQIESALEKVRSRSLAMHTSTEMQEVANEIRNQLLHLGMEIDALAMSGVIDNESDYDVWVGGANSQKPLRIPYNNDTQVQRDFNKAIKERPELFTKTYKGKVMKAYFKHLMASNSFNPEIEQFMLNSSAFTTALTFMKNSGIQIIRYKDAPFSEEDNTIVKRFGKVFEQAYIRFLDLQKAEAQAKEAQIEAALEKVRSRSLSMQRSDELQDVVQVVAEKLTELGVVLEIGGIAICTYFENSKDVMHWTASNDPLMISKPYYIEYYDTPMNNEAWEAKLNGESFFEKVYGAKDCKHYFDNALENTAYKNLPEGYKELLRNTKQHGLTFAIQKNSTIMVPSLEGKLLNEEDKGIVIRFSKVFEQAYIRFMDIKKSEEQARVAQIEAALEKIRSRSLAMHKSEELGEVITVIVEKLKDLGFYIDDGVALITFTPGTKDLTEWMTNPGFDAATNFKLPYFDHPVLNNLWAAKEKGKQFEFKRFNAAESKTFHDYIFTNTDLKNIPQQVKEYCLAATSYAPSIALQKNTAIFINDYSNKNLAEDEIGILKRFAKVFEQAYIRFMDIKKSEEQARESQIQLALERVRARTMAMHKSEELAETAAVLFQQMTELGVTPERINICLIKEDTNVMEVWSTDQEGTKINHHFNASLDEPTTGQRVYKAWKENKKSLTIDLSGDELNNWIRYVREVMGMTIKEELVKEHRIHTVAFFSHGMVLTTTPEPLPEESVRLLERFADVFNLTYRRFLDLQQAEEQARGAQIEAALERVRAKAMAMNNSADLSVTVNTLFNELDTLELTPVRCGIGLMDKENPQVELWATTKDTNEVTLNLAGTVKLILHPVLEQVYKHWELQQEFHPVLKGEELKMFMSSIQKGLKIPDWPEGLPRYDHYFYFPQGSIYVVNTIAATEEELSIYRRFTSVMALTYQRYEDIVKSEERTRQAIKDSSLDRVRAEIASMRSTEDLQRITPLIWRELTTLNVPFFRCGVFIIDEQEKKVNVYLSAPDGHSLGVMHLDFAANELTTNTVESWRKNEVYKAHWDKEAFTSWMKAMSEQGQITDTSTYQGTAVAPESLDLHFIPFKQGMLYVGNSEPLDNEKIEMVNSLAEAFAIAYARYEDFVIIEHAKLQVEKTLVDLKQTQSQLIQSEKMASLGELTAGIAHEIQNPLNFVNNFSEVSNELLDEMLEEAAKGNYEEVKEILNNVKQNLEKINHHGKRADGIVKGMLQHSRSSSSAKEPTDINKLADEYLRLAYHGLRAKDKSFNATMKTEYEEGLRKVNVIPQDMGRVILNLITNAFYVVNEKKKQQPEGFEPTVTVSTKSISDKIQISVKDNGNGIPPKFLDKIFQPFFTTKPTGQGTGLGLSLAFDIVKSHSGELNVETKEGDGSTFIIQIPTI